MDTNQTIKNAKLTRPQLKILLMAKELAARNVGIIPRQGQYACFRRLAKASLLKYVGLGWLENSDDNILRPVYTIADHVDLVKATKG